MGGDAGGALTVHSGYPELLILKTYFHSNRIFVCGGGEVVVLFCILFYFSLSTVDTQGKVMALLEVLALGMTLCFF